MKQEGMEGIDIFSGIVGIFVLAYLMFGTTGCTGFEVGTKAWVSRVDERSEMQRTNAVNRTPLKCYFVDCSQPAAEEK